MYEINGDLKISFFKASAWFFLNVFRNLKISMCTQAFHFHAYYDFCEAQADLSSPGRSLVNQFNHLELEKILQKNVLGCLEIGCGSGSFYKTLKSKSKKATYTGVDLSDRFLEKTSRNCRFIKSDILAFKPHKKFDFIYSNSVLEHCQHDATILKKSYEWLKDGGTALHFLPAASGVFLYPKHGFRQYTICSLKNKIQVQNASIYLLGGFGSFLVHFIFITIPEAIFGFPARKHNVLLYSKVKQLGFRIDPIFPFFGPMVAVVLKKNGPRH